jgi:tetratricopeptide (TPR) repeat protein
MKDQNINELLKQALNLHHNGKLEQADDIYLSILNDDKNNFSANHLHGCILSQNLKYKDALSYLKKACDIDPNNYEANNNLGIVYKNLKDLKNSEKCFKKAMLLNSSEYKAYFNCANLYIDHEKYHESVELLKKILSLNESFCDADHRIGEVYQYIFQDDRKIENLKTSIKWFNNAIIKDPTYVDSYLMLGMSYLWMGNIKEADKSFKKVLNLYSSNTELQKNNIKRHLSDEKLLNILITHEYEQLTFIDNDTDDIRNPKFTKEYYNSVRNLYEESKKGDLDFNSITYDFKQKLFKVLYNKPPKITSSNLLNLQNNIKKIENDYINGSPEVVIIDDFLSDDALYEIQKFCRNANVFKYPYHSGYVGAFLSKGLSNEFILQLSENLRLTYKHIFKELRLTQGWIFKYDSQKSGTNIHADQASVNVNFWISPESANQEKNSGGLRIWNKIPPEDWNFSEYNSLERSPKIREMLISNNIKEQIIPYKENRAVIFNSKLFHSTDDFKFDNSYENRRVNITFLYD